MAAEPLETTGEGEAAARLAEEVGQSTPIRDWQLGLALLLEGDAEQAQFAWLSGLAEGGDPAELIGLLEAAAHQAIDRQAFAQAQRICEQILQLDDDRAAYLLLAEALAQQGKYDEALAVWQQAEPHSGPAAYIHQAEIFQQFAEWEAAIAAYAKAVALAPTGELHVAWGRCYLQIGEIAAAIDHFQQAAHLQPDWAVAYAEWGYALLQQNCLTEANWQFQQAIDRLPPATAQTLRLDRLTQLQRSPTATAKPICDRSLPTPPPIGYDSSAFFAEAIAPATTVKLKPPKSLSTLHFSFRFGEAIELPSMFVATIPNGRFWMSKDETSCACIAADHQFVPELSPEFPIFSPGHPDNHPRHHSILSCVGLPPVEKFAGSIAVLASLQNNLYFHWMFEVLPRWNLLQRSAIDLDSIDYFLIQNHRLFQQETIAKLNIPDSKILSNKFHVQADRLIAPFPGCVAWMNRSTCDFLRSTFLPAIATGSNRIYISRSQTNRRVLNEPEIIEFLKQYQFESVTLETLSVSDQAALFANATVVIAPHGGGLTNLVFCRSNTTVIELFSPNFVYPCYWFLSNLVELDYYYLLGEMPLGVNVQQLLYPDARVEDMSIDVGKLLKLMQTTGVI